MSEVGRDRYPWPERGGAEVGGLQANRATAAALLIGQAGSLAEAKAARHHRRDGATVMSVSDSLPSSMGKAAKLKLVWAGRIVRDPSHSGQASGTVGEMGRKLQDQRDRSVNSE